MDNLWRLLDELQSIARNGLHYATNHYDRERYERLLELASASYGAMLELPADAVRERFRAELGHATPKLGACAAVFDDQERILLVCRADNHRWCLPCGAVEPHETPAEAAVRETREETGLVVECRRLVDVRSRFPGPDTGPHALASVIYLCEAAGGELRGSAEGEEVGFWPIGEVPAWHRNHRDYAEAALALWLAGRESR
ncbi:MAG TPA: NUDIX hydrolase N-terminal domain-containing protein [Herpetosiphonaceae bacterium]